VSTNSTTSALFIAFPLLRQNEEKPEDDAYEILLDSIGAVKCQDSLKAADDLTRGALLANIETVGIYWLQNDTIV
jgi:hypothetical protein